MYGFEQSALLLLDAANELWGQIVHFYSLDESHTQTIIYNDDGTYRQSFFDVNDSENWPEWHRDFDDFGNLISEEYVGDPTAITYIDDGISKTSDLFSFGGQDSGITEAVISNQGASLEITDNSWKHIEIDKQITQNTILSFDFMSDVEGEIHAIGFDNDKIYSADTFFRLDGTQNLGINTYFNQYTTGSGLQHYEIAVGQHFTGSFSDLIFIMDDDAGNGGNSIFQNIEFSKNFSI